MTILVIQKLKFVLGRVESIAEKGENLNAGYQLFLLFPQYFSTAFFSRSVNSLDCVVMGYTGMIEFLE